ncbi:MAG: DUF4395 domain-containing protein [Ardenticatenaceae bacterium]|nr:DUF4395 domain-containing protein [Ardenticatenaceae bacterium]
MATSPVIRKRLEMQGFVDLDDAVLAEVGPWLRFSPALCTVLVGVGTAFASAAVLWAFVPIAVLGAVFPTHPFDLVYNYGLRRLIGTRPLPLNGPPRRFASVVAAVWLVATAWAFGAGLMWVGYLLGGVLAGVTAIDSVSHFCIPSLIYGALFSDPSGETDNFARRVSLRHRD